MIVPELTPAELRARRLALGFSQPQLAKRLGVSTNTVWRWERGVMEIAAPRMLALALERLEMGEPVG